MTRVDLNDHRQQPHAPARRTQLRGRLRWLDPLRSQGVIPLLLATTLGEVACNMVHIALLETIFELSGQSTAVGELLVVQTVPQVLLGIWAGTLVDHLGKRRAAILATLFYAVLAAVLTVSHTIAVVYILAILVMLARLVIIPARLALVSDISRSKDLLITNTVLAIVIAVAAFLGPAVGATLILLTCGLGSTYLVAGLGLLLSALSLTFVATSTVQTESDNLVEVWRGIRSGWEFIREDRLVQEILLYLAAFTLITGAIMPLITPLAHQLGLGSEGTGVFLAVVGIGGLIGAPLAVVLLRRLSPAVALLLTALAVPSGVLVIGLGNSLNSVLAALALTALSGAGLNVIAITILQELTPSEKQGTVFGIEQTLLGVAWLVALVATTAGEAAQLGSLNIQMSFLLIGITGVLLVAFLGSWHWHRLEAACAVCEPPSTILGDICEAMCKTGLHMSSTVCRLICGVQERSGNDWQGATVFMIRRQQLSDSEITRS